VRQLFVLLALLLVAPDVRPASPPKGAPAGVAHTVPRDGMKLALWEKRPPGAAPGYQADGSRVVVLLHGATWSGRPDFDLQIRDYSLMDALARAGYDAFALDIHGYGASEPAESPEDYATADQAVKDVAAAIAYIGELRGIKAVNLFGWSWGAHVAGLYAAEHPEQVVRLVLYGFFPATSRLSGPEHLPKERFKTNTYAATQSDFIDGEYDRDVAARFGRDALAACPRSPLGVAVDFTSRMPLFTPQQLRPPTLLLYGIYDLQPPQRRAKLSPEDFARIEGRCLEFFGQLPAHDRRFVVIPGGGHAVHLERGHRLFHRALIDFLAQGRPLPPGKK
jgi:pimeloyl-ACP methyl ester carboxylesterase